MLGPLEVLREGELLALGGPKQRSLLAILLIHANEAVSRDWLIDGLWGERAPPTAAETLDTYVYRLRKLLGQDRLARRPGGYALRVDAGELDLARFDELLAAAGDAAHDPALAAARLREALALWRGPALADLLYAPFAGGEAQRLEERRLQALERRIDAELAAGAGGELVSELEPLVGKHPVRERLAGQLMLALYRGGRQSDSLAVLQAARLRLSRDLGLMPGPELRELERRILRHDPGLGPPRRAERVPIRPVGRRIFTAAASAAALIAIAGAVLLWSAASSGHSGSANVDRLVPLDAGSEHTAHAVTLDGRPSALAVASGAVWIADSADETVSRVDPASETVDDRIQVRGEPGSLAAGGGAVWAASTLGSTIERIDTRTDTVTQTVRLGNAKPVSLAFGLGRLWVADATDQALIELDPASGSVRQTFSLDLQPTSVAIAAGEVWVAGYDTGTVEEVDPDSGQTIETLRVGDGPSALVAGDGALWVANSLDGTASRIDAQTDSVEATIPVGSGAAALAATKGAIWVANEYSGTVSRIDPHRNEVAATIKVGGSPAALAATGGRLWVGTAALGARHRGGTLRLLTTSHFPTVDPALYDEGPAANGFLFMRLAYDTLVTFEAASGPAGLRLVPDLALQVPIPTENGTTYSFRLRPGIRYSDGRLVKAGDFRRGLERLFRLDAPGVDYYMGIAGATACLLHPEHCNLARGVVTDDATGTVVFHLTAPDPDFLFKLTPYALSAPIPPGTPEHDVGLHPVPGTGPYRIASANATGVRFARNPYFHEWSHAAQPDGYPNTLVWQYSKSRAATVRAIEDGSADWTLDLIPPAQLRVLQTRFPSQLHTSPAPIVEFVHLNTHAAPFDDVRVRQALNYAIDRRKIAEWYGGPTVATPTCQPLAQGLPGFTRYCPYTLHPRADGVWTAPDLAKARRLVAASGTRGERVDVWGETDEVAVPTQEPAYIASILRSLGYRVRLHLAPGATITIVMRRTHQLSVDGDWLPDFPDPSSYLPQFFSCNGGNGNGYYCDPKLDRELQKATLLEGSDPARADALWTSIDHELTDRAGWVPTVDLNAVELVSRRLGSYEYNPVWGFVPSQAWLR